MRSLRLHLIVNLREPRDHVRSMWKHCNYAGVNKFNVKFASWLTATNASTKFESRSSKACYYSPHNMQTRYLSPRRKVDLTLAVETVKRAFHVGITGLHHVSWCVLHAKLGNSHPSCRCKANPAKEEVHTNIMGAWADIVQDVETPVDRATMDRLTKLDLSLYTTGVSRLFAEVQQLNLTCLVDGVTRSPKK